MEKLRNEIEDALRRIKTLVIIARWIWIVNSVVLITSITRHRLDIAGLAAFTCVFGLIAAAMGRRASRYLATAEQTIQSS